MPRITIMRKLSRCLLGWLCVMAMMATTTLGFASIRPSFIMTRSAASSLPSLFATTPASASAPTVTDAGFIATELRGAAMKLHTTRQAPEEGTIVVEQETKEYIPTHADYLQFLVDSQHVYQALEDVVNAKEELAPFRNTGLERTRSLETDIQFMIDEYGLEARPAVGGFGKRYADEIRAAASVPEFMCHYYNFYFAHTAGGRMIGKKMAALLLNKKTLEFYKWDGDLNEIKAAVKQNIEDMSNQWSREEKDACVNATASAFRGGGGINAYLNGGRSSH